MEQEVEQGSNQDARRHREKNTAGEAHWAQGPTLYPVTALSAQAVQGDANSLVPPTLSTPQVGRNSLVHTNDRGSVHSVAGTGCVAQADIIRTATRVQKLRILFSRVGKGITASESLTLCCTPRTLNLRAAPQRVPSIIICRATSIALS